MCVGIIVSSMPSLAKFVQHQFPGFSVVDSFLSTKSILLKVRHDKVPRAMAPDSGSNEHIIHGPHFSDSDRPYKKLGNHLDRNDIELGNVSCVTACEEGKFAGATSDSDGIYIKRAWEQSYQKNG
ncbi:MAG: hypothetical protein LQ345_003211 [Seirophora villosa]|nr:MAG: hypothetical protein LQ345_003211 [Seirophora villosa]